MENPRGHAPEAESSLQGVELSSPEMREQMQEGLASVERSAETLRRADDEVRRAPRVHAEEVSRVERAKQKMERLLVRLGIAAMAFSGGAVAVEAYRTDPSHRVAEPRHATEDVEETPPPAPVRRVAVPRGEPSVSPSQDALAKQLTDAIRDALRRPSTKEDAGLVEAQKTLEQEVVENARRDARIEASLGIGAAEAAALMEELNGSLKDLAPDDVRKMIYKRAEELCPSGSDCDANAVAVVIGERLTDEAKTLAKSDPVRAYQYAQIAFETLPSKFSGLDIALESGRVDLLEKYLGGSMNGIYNLQMRSLEEVAPLFDKLPEERQQKFVEYVTQRAEDYQIRAAFMQGEADKLEGTEQATVQGDANDALEEAARLTALLKGLPY